MGKIWDMLNTKVDFVIKSDDKGMNIMVAPAGYIFQPKPEIKKEMKKFIDLDEVKLIE